jgi:hypothetical protein
MPTFKAVIPAIAIRAMYSFAFVDIAEACAFELNGGGIWRTFYLRRLHDLFNISYLP